IAPRDMLIHSRLVNLFQQPMRRLADIYRFDIPVAEWLESSEAATAPGTVFPISDEERLANCYFNGTCS
ncbi:MAG: RagB/SusD family nutrient uptake outer membrane protein, partial [Longimicrobiales bacterium]